MAAGHFVRLFLQGVARQALATGAVMVGELGGRLARLEADMKDARRNCGTVSMRA